MCSTLSKCYSTKSKALLAEPFGQRLLVNFTALSPFYVTLHGCSLLDNEEHIVLNNHMKMVLPCINTQQTAVKKISKDQQPYRRL